MARHGRHRHASLRFGDDARAPRAQGVRRVIKTPTFALGFGVLTAAVLAFGTTQTYLRFSGSDPGEGCGATGCASPTARPTQPPGPSAAKSSHNGDPAVQITYTTLSAWATGFTGQLAITNRSDQELTRWKLAISYSGSQITKMTGAEWQPRSHSASGTIKPAALPDPMDAGKTVRITYTATGNAGPPTGCTFDGTRCQIRSTVP